MKLARRAHDELARRALVVSSLFEQCIKCNSFMRFYKHSVNIYILSMLKFQIF